MKLRLATFFAIAAALPPAAFASHSFPADVPDSHPFHTEIGIFKDTNITVGCTATAFCPQDFVRRQAMAAFIDRALGLLVRPGDTTQKAVAGSRVEMLDDDLSFAGTEGNALRYRGPNDNVVGGHSTNFVLSGLSQATVAGGWDNGVTNDYGSIGGGAHNRVDYYGSIPGGASNAAAAYSFAAGNRAKAFHQGSFVFADAAAFDFPTGGINTFIVRARGGADFVSAIDATTGGATAGVSLSAGASSWTSISDRKAKRDFKRVDGAALLRRLAGVPITTWRYKAEPGSVRHIGPMAQDFRRAFGVGKDPRGITTIDADGVALAAIQALLKRNQTLEARVAALEQKARKR